LSIGPNGGGASVFIRRSSQTGSVFVAVSLPHASRSDFTISCGDPQRNKNYRAALFGAKKSDPVEARAAARYAVTEQPPPSAPLPNALRTLRQVAGRLQAVVRQRTRLINQFHHLLALTFPELALLTKDIAAGWVLELCHRFPTARHLAQAASDQLQQIPYLPHERIEAILEAARTSIASLVDDTIAELVRDQVRQLRDAHARQLRLEKTVADAYHALPEPNHLDSIPGYGAVTAAVLTAFILDIDRFETPTKLVAYFGAMPIEVGSGGDGLLVGMLGDDARVQETNGGVARDGAQGGHPEIAAHQIVAAAAHDVAFGRAGVAVAIDGRARNVRGYPHTARRRRDGSGSARCHAWLRFARSAGAVANSRRQTRQTATRRRPR
jgi:transposase